MECAKTLSYKSLESLCRICLKAQCYEDTVQLFSEQLQAREILEKIYCCFQIMLSFKKNLPSLICNSCIGELKAADSFRLKCETFKERYQELCTKSIPEQPEKYEMEYDGDNSKHSSDDYLEYSTNLSVMQEDSKDIATVYKCDECNKKLKTKKALLKHIVSMHRKRKHVGIIMGSGVDRRYHCKKCSYSTPHSQTLKNHMRKHDGQRPYACDCGNKFTQLSSLTAHQKTHSNTFDYTCSSCGKQFKFAHALKRHSLVHENSNLSCNLCHKNLKSLRSLKQHMDRHYNVRNYSCEDCGATFVTCSDLLNHKISHGAKTVECHLCGFKTHTKYSLVLHLKRHTGDKTFKCDKCEVTAYTCSELRTHQRVHSKEKSYPCPQCVQHFTYSSSLNKHMFRIHGIAYKWGNNQTRSLHGSKTVKDDIQMKQ